MRKAFLPRDFASNVRLAAGGHWIWTGRAFNGYGRFTGPTGIFGPRAHRFAWMVLRGEIPDGCVVHHDCGIKLCVNPAHLRMMTVQEHRDLHAAELRGQTLTHCRRGHEMTRRNTYIQPSNGARVCRECKRHAPSRNFTGRKLARNEYRRIADAILRSR